MCLHYFTSFFMKDVAGEYRTAVAKCPDWPVDAIHATAILSEEAGKLTRSANDHVHGLTPDVDTRENIKRYAARVTAMAFRIYENIPRY